MKNTKQLLGARIKEIRKARGLSQAVFAEKVEIASNYLSRIEVGAKFPSVDMLEKMSVALKVDIKDFFDFKHLDAGSADIEELLKEANNEQCKLIYKIVTAVIKV